MASAAACYGHADVGCLHIRPIINVKTTEGVATLRSIAREVSDLVVEFGGAMSGEHGDGLARSLWNRKLFGPEVYAAFAGRSNARSTRRTCSIPARSSATPIPATTCGSARSTTRTSLRTTLLDFSGQGGFARAVEMCSGVGACRKTGERHDVPQLHGHARRDAHDPRPRQPAPPGR